MLEEQDPTCPHFLIPDSAATTYHPDNFYTLHEAETQNSALRSRISPH